MQQVGHHGKSVAIGLVAGFAGGLLGVGGAFVMVPGMTLMLGMTQRRAQATALGVTMFAAAAAVVPYLLQAMPPLLPLAALVGGGTAGAMLGATNVGRLSESTLRRAFGVMMLALIPTLLLLPALDLSMPGRFEVPALAVVGVAAGAFSGLLGIGSGTIVVPAVVAFGGLEQSTAQAISLLAMIPTAFVASTIHSRTGFLDHSALPWIVGGALAGGPVGGIVAVNAPRSVLLALLVALLTVTGLGMLNAERLRKAT